MIITLFCNIGPKFQVPCVFPHCAEIWRFSGNLVRITGHSVYILVPLIYCIRLIPLISADLARLGFYWLILNWAFLLSFLTKRLSLFCEMRCRNLIMAVCKCAHRNLKLQLYLVWPTAKKFECIMIFKDDEWPGRKMTIFEEIGILNCLLPTMVT